MEDIFDAEYTPPHEEEVARIFAPDLFSAEKANDLYASFCNNEWEKDGVRLSYSWRAAAGLVADIRNTLDIPLVDPDVCERCSKRADEHYKHRYKSGLSHLIKEKTGEDFYLQTLLCKEGEEESFLPGYSGKEDYLDFYCSGNEGSVAPWVADKLEGAGYKKIANS
jgi:hypothetical protein